MPFIDPKAMLHGSPLSGWSGRFFHSASMTFGHWEIAEDAADLHEHEHPEEEVWNMVAGELILVIDGRERRLGPGDAAVIPPHTRHSAKTVGACQAIMVDHPVRFQLPGVPPARSGMRRGLAAEP